MLQLTQTLRNGALRVVDVPFPALGAGMVLVRVHYSVVSAGTEGRTVRDARAGYLAKSRARRAELSKVVRAARTVGARATYRAVMDRLETPVGLGYSCAGEVIAVGAEVTDLAPGDRVACGGASAGHAEVVAVPRNLCVRIAGHVDPRHAAFTTLGAIALQGLRQAELELGSTCVVIGLGVVGLLTVQLIDAAGARCIGIDIDSGRVARGLENGAALALPRAAADLEAAVAGMTGGAGADAVIITASTRSSDPVELAGRLCRHKGRVVVVGDVPTGFQRKVFYQKELDLRMSCSYGPGRYDRAYEEHGLDYPIGYVRWTENRNMQAFADLLAAGKLRIDSLITHTFPLRDAPAAYELILKPSEPFAGILLEYAKEQPVARCIQRSADPPRAGAVAIGMIGAGSFGRGTLLPLLAARAELVGIATARPSHARHVADRFGFRFCSGDARDVLDDERVNAIVIATRHDLHGPLVLEALRRGRHVFVEKPLCLDVTELEQIAEEHARQNVHLMVGFNRRFSRHVRALRDFLPEHAPKAINYRINAGALAHDHWMHDARTGGGRLLGEVCHFIDLARHLAGARIEQVGASALAAVPDLQDTLVINLRFANGGVASIGYFSNGPHQLRKERLEVFAGGRAAVIDDFRETRFYGARKRRVRSRAQDKGHAQEVATFLSAVGDGGPAPIRFDELYDSMRATFRVRDSLQAGRPLPIP